MSDPNNNRLGSKQFWHLAKTFLGNQTGIIIPPLTTHADILLSDNKAKADLFNQYFASQCKLPPSADTDDLPLLNGNTISNIDDINFDVIDVYKILLSLKSSKATGPDQIGNIILRNCAAPLSEPFFQIFKTCISEGTYPASWKLSHVVPVHKKKSRQKVEHYRPISLLSNSSKVFERIIFNQLYAFLDKNKLLTPLNSGFKKGDSTINQLIYLVHNIYKGLENRQDIKIVFLDFSKAFDRVWHRGLIFKLERLGVRGKLLKLIKNYLLDRKQMVVIEGIMSDSMYILAGVPQGSILGPLLFLVYINDLPDEIKCKINLFADDSIVWDIVADPISTTSNLNKDLISVQQWANKWHMSLNAEKTEVLTISAKIKKTTYPRLKMDEVELSEATSHKHLGLILSVNMSWSPHVHSICSRASLRINILRYLSFRFNRKTIELLYMSYIRPILEYASPLFGSQTLANAAKLENIQAQAALICTGALQSTNRYNLMAELGWNSLAERRKNATLSLTYKAVNHIAPIYFSDMYVP